MNANRFGLAGRLLAVASAAFLLASCPSAQPEDEPAMQDALVYSVVIDDLVSQVSIQTDDPETLPTLFVESFDPNGIPLEVQVDLVAEFGERYDVRFVDDRVEAVDVEMPDSPVRPESVLIGLGAIVGDDALDIRGELYRSAIDIRAFRYTVDDRTDFEWIILGTPEEVEPEGFGVVS